MTSRSLIAIALACSFAIACSKPTESKPGDLELRRALSAPGMVVLDVRTQAEWDQGHVPGALHVPMKRLATITTKLPSKHTQIIVHCAAGVRSLRATALLDQLGYTNVFDAKTPGRVATAMGTKLVK